MELIKFILITIFCGLLGFGSWYAILWFITSEPNPMLWHWSIRTLFLFLGVSSSVNMVNEITK